MNTQPQNNAPTFESVWVLSQETWRQIQESNRFLTERQAETDRLMREMKERQAEADQLLKKVQAENDRLLKERQTEHERVFHEKCDRYDKMFAQTREQIGGITRSNGEFCEEYFVNAFKENPTFLGEKYDRVLDNLRPDPDLAIINDQYDLVLRNGKTVVLIEMKYKAGTDDVGRMFRKLESYRANYPMYKDYKTYLGLASFRFSAAVRERADEMGVVLIQQQGEKIEVISEKVRAWYA